LPAIAVSVVAIVGSVYSISGPGGIQFSYSTNELVNTSSIPVGLDAV